MNIQKTNRIGIRIAEKGFIGSNKDLANLHKDCSTALNCISINASLLRRDPNAKVVRVSKSIIETCNLIDFNSIKENIDNSNFLFKSMWILLDNDDSGIIKIERFGSDFGFLFFSKLSSPSPHICYNSYSFIDKSFYLDNEMSDVIGHIDQSEFVVKLLTYLIFGDITEVFLMAKTNKRNGFTRILNSSKLNVVFCDTLWRQRINTDGFKVRGHFRLQPIGENRKGRKLIWIEEYDKHGYNRKATIELVSQK